MKLLTPLLALSLISCKQAADDSKIWGTWKSDKEATLEYIAENTKCSAYRMRYFKAFYGNSEITFNKDGAGSIKIAPYELPLEDGQSLELPASSMDFTYEILEETEVQVVTKLSFSPTADLAGMDELFRANPCSIAYFPDKDTFWAYASNGFIDIHTREYFSRVAPNQENKTK